MSIFSALRFAAAIDRLARRYGSLPTPDPLMEASTKMLHTAITDVAETMAEVNHSNRRFAKNQQRFWSHYEKDLERRQSERSLKPS